MPVIYKKVKKAKPKEINQVSVPEVATVNEPGESEKAVAQADFAQALRRILRVNRWVFSLDVSLSEKMVLLAMANNIKTSYPTITKAITKTDIAKYSSLHKKTVGTTINKLTGKGIIERLEQDVYRLHYVKQEMAEFSDAVSMRIINTNRAIFKLEFDQYQKAVLLVIANHSDRHGGCKLEGETIKKAVGISDNKLWSTLGELESGEWLTRENRIKKNKQKSSNRYKLHEMLLTYHLETKKSSKLKI